MHPEESLFQLKNYRPHPSDGRYVIFIYHDYRMACSFEDGLKQFDIAFEHDTTESGPNKRWLYAVDKREIKQAIKLNNLAIGKYRKPFIADPVLRYAVLSLSLGLIAMAIYGFLKST